MKGEISYRDQNRFLYQAVDMFIYLCCKVGHFNVGMNGDFWSQPQVATQKTAVFSTSALASFFGLAGCCFKSTFSVFSY